MKILICTDSFYPGIGGTEAACFGYANALVDAGHEVVLACPSYGKMPKDDSSYKFKVIRLPSVKVGKNEYAVLANLQISRLKRDLKNINFIPDIIHTETVSGMAKIGLALGKKRNIPVVMTIHTKFKEAFEKSLGRFITSFVIKNLVRKLDKADKVITVAKNMKAEIKEYGFSGEVEVINNGAMFQRNPITMQKKNSIRKNLGFDAKDKILIFVGRMVQYKRIEFVMRAFGMAVEKGLDAKFVLVGEGDDLPNLKKLAQKLNLENRVVFVGAISDRAKVIEYYQMSDLFVTASIFDTDPIVVVEAASCQVPSLVIENTGCSERLTDGLNGFIAKNDEKEFVDKLLKIFSKDISDVALKALDTVPTSWAKNVSEHIPIYEKLIKEKDTIKKD